MSAARLYDEDVLAWSDDQTAALAALSRAHRATGIDWQNVIAVIATVGREEEMRVHDGVRTILRHVIEGYCDPDSHRRIGWSVGVAIARIDIETMLSDTVRTRVDLDALWSEAFDLAIQSVRDEILTVPPGIPAACPFTLDDLLDEGFTYETAVKRLYDRLDALTKDRSP